MRISRFQYARPHTSRRGLGILRLGGLSVMAAGLGDAQYITHRIRGLCA